MNTVALLIPVYNSQAALERTIASLESEATCVDFIIVDDGSDPPVLLPEEVGGKHGVKIIRLDSNAGIATALNIGLRYILNTGYEFVARLDAGDICRSNRITKQLDFLQANENCALLSSYIRYVDMKGNHLFVLRHPTTHELIARRMHLNSCFSHTTAIFRVSAVRHVGLYSTRHPAAEDYEYFFRFVRRFQTANLPEVLADVETNPAGISIQKRKQQVTTRLRVQLQNLNPMRLESYVGLLRSLVALATPLPLLVFIKRSLDEFRLKGFRET